MDPHPDQRVALLHRAGHPCRTVARTPDGPLRSASDHGRLADGDGYELRAPALHERAVALVRSQLPAARALLRGHHPARRAAHRPVVPAHPRPHDGDHQCRRQLRRARGAARDRARARGRHLARRLPGSRTRLLRRRPVLPPRGAGAAPSSPRAAARWGLPFSPRGGRRRAALDHPARAAHPQLLRDRGRSVLRLLHLRHRPAPCRRPPHQRGREHHGSLDRARDARSERDRGQDPVRLSRRALRCAAGLHPSTSWGTPPQCSVSRSRRAPC